MGPIIYVFQVEVATLINIQTFYERRNSES
jgi:hypothetical protein